MACSSLTKMAAATVRCPKQCS
ncbi:hypothetical protein ID866_11605 [Astraeus odoratus]|nr:hypothetical protein ID866_11605 [Astraeus odoratus]